MFQQASAFDQDIGDWDMSKGVDFVSSSIQCLSLHLIILTFLVCLKSTYLDSSICYGRQCSLICSTKLQISTKILGNGMCQRALIL